MRIRRLLLVLPMLSVVLLLGASPATAKGDLGIEHIAAYDVNVRIEDDGSILVIETIDYDFGVVPKRGIFRDIPVREDWERKEHHDRVYPLEVLSVRATEGTPADYTVESIENGKVERIRIGDPDVTITGDHGYEITYRVERVFNPFDDHDELVWDVIGHHWPVTIDRATVTVEAPGEILAVGCNTGPVGSTTDCAASNFSGSVATFSQTNLFPGSGMTATVAIPKGVVPEPSPKLEERWHLARPFQLTPITVGGSLGLLVVIVGGVLLFIYAKARDRRYVGSPVDAAFGTGNDAGAADEELVPLSGEAETPVEFEPPDDLRPGQVGTLIDFTANPLDVTATIVDLAVRRYLVIEEVADGKPDWKLTKKKEPEDLEPYERKLMEGLFRGDDTEVQISDLKYKFAKRMEGVRQALMDDAMKKRWFTKEPGTVQLGYGCLGFLLTLAGLAGLVLTIIFTRWALLTVPVVIGGLVLLFGARVMPARTAKGYAVLRRTLGFRRFIEESEAERARFAERKNLFSEYLPYAIVFGATDKWARAFAGLGDELPDTSSWYVGTTAFSVVAFSSSIDSFTVSSAGTLTSTPPSSSSSSGSSGFSGGGFSGGGGGGGGGGSW